MVLQCSVRKTSSATFPLTKIPVTFSLLNMYSFKAKLKIIGINPFVTVPASLLKKLFNDAGKSKGAIPIHGTVNSQPYRQTLVRYSQAWRLYVNSTMLKKSPQRIGESLSVTVAFDTADRSVQVPASLAKALKANKAAKKVFENLPTSRQKEIARYIANLKTKASVERNVAKAISFLLGKTRFVGRDAP